MKHLRSDHGCRHPHQRAGTAAAQFLTFGTSICSLERTASEQRGREPLPTLQLHSSCPQGLCLRPAASLGPALGVSCRGQASSTPSGVGGVGRVRAESRVVVTK